MVWRDSSVAVPSALWPSGGAYSYEIRAVLPASGPYSRKTVVSRTSATLSGIIEPLVVRDWPVDACWYAFEYACRLGSLNDWSMFMNPADSSMRWYRSSG